MKKLAVLITACALLLSVSSVYAEGAEPLHAGPDRPANATGDSPAVVTVIPGSTTEGAYHPMGEPGYHQVVAFPEPSTLVVSIWDRDSNGAEIPNTWRGNVTVDFETYVKDVLPNEWLESWGNSGGLESLKAGALAVKTFAWYHVVNWKKDPEHGAHVKNGTSSQMYTAGSNKPYCNTAVDSVRNSVIGNYTVNKNGTVSTTLLETGYRARQTTPGSIMGQYATYQDALNGMYYTDIVLKWYKDLNVKVCPQSIWVAN